MSKLQFVDLPGAERLAEDPEVLRLREGPTVNRQLHAFAATLRSLAEGPGGGLAAAATANGGSAGGASFVGQPRPGSSAAWGGGGLGSGGGGPVGVGPMYVGVGSAMPLVNYEASALTKLLAGGEDGALLRRNGGGGQGGCCGDGIGRGDQCVQGHRAGRSSGKGQYARAALRR